MPHPYVPRAHDVRIIHKKRRKPYLLDADAPFRTQVRSLVPCIFTMCSRCFPPFPPFKVGAKIWTTFFHSKLLTFFLSTLIGGEGDWGPMVGIGQYAWDEPCMDAASVPVLLSWRKSTSEKSARNSRPHQTGNAEKSCLNESSIFTSAAAVVCWVFGNWRLLCSRSSVYFLCPVLFRNGTQFLCRTAAICCAPLRNTTGHRNCIVPETKTKSSVS